jgi:hypothetical protein
MSAYVHTELTEYAALATRLLKSDQIIKSSSMSIHASIWAQGTTQGVLLPLRHLLFSSLLSLLYEYIVLRSGHPKRLARGASQKKKTGHVRNARIAPF